MTNPFEKHKHHDVMPSTQFLDKHDKGKCSGFMVEAVKEKDGSVFEKCTTCGTVVKRYPKPKSASDRNSSAS